MSDSAEFGHAAQSEPERRGPEVHGASGSNPRVLGVLDDGDAELASRSQRVAHQVVLEDGLAIVADRDCSCLLQRGKVGELLALTSDGCGGDGKQADDSLTLGSLHPAGDLG